MLNIAQGKEMAIKLEFISLIVPIQKIDQYYPGGFNTFIAERIPMFGGRLWYDNYLFRDGPMDFMDMEDFVGFRKRYVLPAFHLINGFSARWSTTPISPRKLPKLFPRHAFRRPVTVKIRFTPKVSIYVKGKQWAESKPMSTTMATLLP
jgi:hypothetical protein